MPNPLARHENRQFHMQFDFTHLERRRMPVAHQVTNKARIILHGFCPLTVADSRSLADGGIIPHIVDNPHKPMIQNGLCAVKVIFHTWRHSPQGQLRI